NTPKFHQQEAGSILILPVGSMHDKSHDQPERVHGNVPLPASDLLGSIVSTFEPTFCSSDRLTVENGDAGAFLLSHSLPDLFSKSIVNGLPHATANPASKNAIHGAPAREVPRQHSPLAAGSNDIQNGVQNPSPIDAGTPSSRWLGEKSTN